MDNNYKVTVSGLSDGTLERAIADIQGRLTGLQKAASGIQIGGGVYQGTAGSPAFSPVVPSGSAAGVAQASAQTAPPLAGPPPPSVTPPLYTPPAPGPSGMGATSVANAASGFSPRGAYTTDRYRDYQSAQQVGFQGNYAEYQADRHEQKMGRMEAQAERENQKRDERLQKQEDARDRKRIYDEDAAQVRADAAHDRMLRSRYTAQNTSVGRQFGFASMDDDDIPRHVQNAMGGNPFSKFDPSLYNSGDPNFAAGMAGLRGRAALQSVFSYNATNSAYVRGQQRYVGQAGIQLASTALGGGLSMYASNTASGEIDPMQAAGLYGSIGGGILGAVGGAFVGSLAPVPEPGLGILLGVQGGMTIGSAAAQAIQAPFMRTRSAVSSLASVAARYGQNPYDLVGAAMYHPNYNARTSQQTGETTPGGLSDMAHTISMYGKSAREIGLIKSGLYTGTDIISTPQIAQTFASFASAELNNGRNDLDTTLGLTGRFASKYGINASGLSKTAAGVLAKSASLGDNRGDLMLSAGPEAYGLFADATGNRDFSPRQLRAYGDQQRSRNALDRASTLASGVGAARERAGRNLLHDLAPFGTDTLAYQSAEADQRGHRLQAFEEQGMATTGLEAVRLSGQRDRLNLMPYSPGNIIGNQIAMSKNAGREANRIGAYLTAHKGELSEEQTLQLEQRRQGQLTQSWEAAALLSEGMTNRLPALSSNAPAGIGVQRFTSWTLAAKNADLMGIPSREWGSNNGAHLARQNALFANMGGTASMSNATSTTAGFNTSAETNQLLRQLISVVSGQGNMGGAGRGRSYGLGSPTDPNTEYNYRTRRDERELNLQGGLDRRDIGQDRTWNNGAN